MFFLLRFIVYLALSFLVILIPNSFRIFNVLMTSSDSSKFEIFTLPVESEARISALCEIDLSPEILIEPLNLSTFVLSI